MLKLKPKPRLQVIQHQGSSEAVEIYATEDMGYIGAAAPTALGCMDFTAWGDDLMPADIRGMDIPPWPI